jgi:hypothetical protein
LILQGADWLAGLLRLEDGTLSEDEVQEALRCRISYHPDDIVFVEWGAAVVVDRDCDETLHTIEFANLQLLEYRLIDQRVGDALIKAQRYIAHAARSWLPFWRTYARPLRALNEMRIDAVGTFERTSNTLLLVGDQYVSRVYRLIAERLRLNDWTNNFRRSLDVTEAVHETLSSQAAMFRLEFLETLVVLLILLEIVMAIIGL